MALTKYKLGELIEACDERNRDGKFSIDDVRGISIQKEFIETKADLNGVSLKPYKLVKPGQFAYVTATSRNGNKITIARNDTNHTYIVSTYYVVFEVTRTDLLNADYLFMYFNRPEFDRYARRNSWGAAREYFWLSDMGDIELDLPPLAVQEKAVAVYRAMGANLRSYEQGLADLKRTCDALMDRCKHNSPKISVGDILREVDNRNADNQIQDVQGINIMKQFMPSVANTTGVDLSKYKLVQKGQFAFSGMQTGRDECIRIALFQEETPIIISPAYSVLKSKREDILPEYVMMWFSRDEVDRLGWFLSDGSIRTNLDMDRFYEIEIPVPPLSMQQNIVNIYKAYLLRKEIAEKLKAQMRELCPILIKGSLEEGEGRG